MNIILIDRKADLAKEHAARLTALNHRVWYWNVNCAEFCDGKAFFDEQAAPKIYGLALVHIGDVSDLETASKGCPRVVVYSGGGDPQHESYPGIGPPVGIDSPIPPDALHRICAVAQLSPSDIEWRKAVDELFNDEPLLAFRLLCEAKKECGSEDSKPFGSTGITIHAPKKLNEWLAPFDGKDENDIERVSGLIASEPVKAKVKAVFESVPDNDNVRRAISEFEKAVNATKNP